MLAKLTGMPGVRRHQVGDREFRLLLPADYVHDSGAIRAISRLLRIRTRRVPSERQKLALLQGRPFVSRGPRIEEPRTMSPSPAQEVHRDVE